MAETNTTGAFWGYDVRARQLGGYWPTSYYSPPLWYGSRGTFGGGDGPSNVIDYVTIATTGNATDFGDLTIARENPAACANGTRGVFGGGEYSGGNYNVIDYVTIATPSNAINFGNLSVGRRFLAACSGT
jgi:hypothetical protein